MRRVLITGGASGIGAACVRRFHGDGCRVAVLDRERSEGPAEFAFTCDVSDPESLAGAVDEAVAALGGLDVVVAAAGIAARGTAADTDPDDWDRVLGVNLRGVYLTGRAAIPHLRAAGGGAIVNIASQLGLVAAADRPWARGHPRQLRLPGADGHAAPGAVLRCGHRPGRRAPGLRGDAAPCAPRDRR
jgi:NAD(P)-dependent dehydrogenase (short-subunit alcohol dehydrogenase family)